MARINVGVDIGTTAIRIVEVSGADDDGYVTVTRAHVEAMPDKALVGGEIHDETAVGNTLRTALDEFGNPSRFVIGLSTRRSDLTEIDVPTALQGRTRDAYIRNSGTELSNRVKLRDAAVSWSPADVDPTTTNPNDSDEIDRVLVALAHQADLDKLLRACSIADAKPAIVDLTHAAIVRAASRAREGVRDTETVIDLGAGSTLIATRTGSAIRSLRAVPQAGSHITRELMGPLKVGFDDADDRKKHLRISTAGGDTRKEASLYVDVDAAPDSGGDDDVSYALAEAAGRLVTEIVASIDADEQQHGNRTKRILLTGQGAQLRGLAELIGERTGIDTRIGPPWVTMAKNKKTASVLGNNSEPSASLLLELGTAVGLAMWKAPA